MIYLTLFFEFFKIGLFSIGGGLATLPFLYEIADKYTWLTNSMIADMIAISQSTPGPIGINMATYAGFKAGGILGGLVATFSIVFPSFIIIVIVANFLNKFKNSVLVGSAFEGLRPAVTGLIAVAWFEIIKTSIINISKFLQTNNLLDIVINFKAFGCQFITVDAINESRVMKFYTADNGFTPLTNYDMYNSTRRLYLPLAVFK